MVARETSSLATVTAALAAAEVNASASSLAAIARFVEILEAEAIPFGFVGPQEAGRLIDRHVLEAAVLSRFLEGGEGVVDVGSGAGLPGVVLACLGWRVELVEALGRRALFLASVVDRLGVPASVRQVRAEEAGRDPDRRGSFDAVVARALAAPPVALELCMPLAREGGTVLILATPGSAEDDARAARAAEALGGAPPRWFDLDGPPAQARHVMIVDKIGPTPERYPRRPGIPKKRPLG